MFFCFNWTSFDNCCIILIKLWQKLVCNGKLQKIVSVLCLCCIYTFVLTGRVTENDDISETVLGASIYGAE